MPTAPPVFRRSGAQRRVVRVSDKARGNSTQRGYGHRWQKAREACLREHPLCVECASAGRVTPATVVDHIDPHRGDTGKFWDMMNWQSLCQRHHNQKTARGE